MWWSASAVRSDRDAPNRPCAACLHVLEGSAKRGVVGDRGVPGYAIPPSAQVARFPNSGIRHTRGMTDLLKARHGETVPLALHPSRSQQLPTTPRRMTPDELTAVTDSGRDAGWQCRQCNFGCNLHADSAAFTRTGHQQTGPSPTPYRASNLHHTSCIQVTKW